MIAGRINDVEAQLKMTSRLNTAFAFLKRTNLDALPEGRIEIEGSSVYAMLQVYETLPHDQARIEAHKKYIDLQYICEGEETFGWIPNSRLAVNTEYDETKDVYFGQAPVEDLSLVRLAAGELVVFFPEDAHAPKLMGNRPVRVKKIVVKVAV